MILRNPSESSSLTGNRRTIGRSTLALSAPWFSLPPPSITSTARCLGCWPRKMGWNEAQYGYIVTSFQVAYALGLLVMGPLVDRVGSRIGYAIAVAIWSVSAMVHSLARSVTTFAMARFGLGFGESGNFPSALKTVAEWFPQRERALATGIFNSGTNIGATFAPLLPVPWIAVHLGWQYAFLMTGAFSAIWIACWLKIYRRPQEDAKLSTAELDYIQSDPPETVPKIPWARLLHHRQAWVFILGKFLTDPVWWFFLYWLPKFLSSEHHVTLSGLALPLIVIYNVATVGSIVGGWLPERFMKAGWTVNRARKTTMLICAFAVVPVISAAGIESLWGSVTVISLAVAAHQGWSCNLLTFPSDMFPSNAVASVGSLGMLRRRNQRSHDRYGSRTSPEGDRQLCAPICLRGLHVFVYLVFDSASFSAAKPCNEVVNPCES